MSTWLIPREELTPEQLRAIEMDPAENRVILGGPGSGKTQILLHRAAFLAERLTEPTRRYHIFVYTNALRAYIQSALAMLSLPDSTVSTLDSWCMAFFRERIGGKTPWNAANKCPDFAAIRNAVFSKISSAGAKPYRFVLVDEAQDLDADAFRLLAAIADHVTVCADHKQQLYDNGSNVEVILQSLAVRRCNITLLETFRCCPYVVQLAATLIDDPVERNAYIRQSRTHQAEREMPLLYRAVNFDDEKARLIDVVRTRLTRGERIAVLFPQQRQAYGYATGFQQAGIDVENPKELDFSTDRPKLMPYHSAKGLTFDSVFLPRLIDKSFDKVSPIRRLRMLFVGITRATKWVYLSTTTGDKSFAPLDQLASEAVGHNLTVQLPTADLKAQSPGPERESTDDIADLL